MSIQSEINRINGEVSTQTDLISQIRSALDGKTAGSGSSGGASVETCTVTITTTSNIGGIAGTLCVDGVISNIRYGVHYTQGASKATISDVVCNSGLCVFISGGYTLEIENATVDRTSVDEMAGISVHYCTVNT